MALLAPVLLSSCASYVRARIDVVQQVRAAELPEPEIVASKSLEGRLGDIRKVSIFFLAEGTGPTSGFVNRPDVRELERSFVRGGYTVLEVRQLSQDRIEALRLDASEIDQYAPEADAIVLVYEIGARDVTRGEVRAEPVFEYGSRGNFQVKTADQIDRDVRKGSMADVVADVKKFMDEKALKVAPAQAAFIDAKIIDARSREVLMFYRAYTLVDAEDLPLGAQRESYEVGLYRYNGQVERFVAEKKDEPVQETGYGDLSQTRKVDVDKVALGGGVLALIGQACDDLVHAFKTPESLRY